MIRRKGYRFEFSRAVLVSFSYVWSPLTRGSVSCGGNTLRMVIGRPSRRGFLYIPRRFFFVSLGGLFKYGAENSLAYFTLDLLNLSGPSLYTYIGFSK